MQDRILFGNCRIYLEPGIAEFSYLLSKLLHTELPKYPASLCMFRELCWVAGSPVWDSKVFTRRYGQSVVLLGNVDCWQLDCCWEIYSCKCFEGTTPLPGNIHLILCSILTLTERMTYQFVHLPVSTQRPNCCNWSGKIFATFQVKITCLGDVTETNKSWICHFSLK